MEIVFYTKTDGTKPAGEFIRHLEPKMKAKINHAICVLQEYGVALREPYSKYIGDGIFELRAKVGSDISRVLYFFFVGNQAVITNGFIKKSHKTPQQEIELAKKYRTDFERREVQKNGGLSVSQIFG